MRFTALERRLISWFANSPRLPALSVQLEAASPRSREYTGVGLFVELEVPQRVEPLPAGTSSPIPGPEISSSSLPNGGGSLLFHRDGVASMLEVYTYTDAMSEDLPDFELQPPQPN